MVIVRATHNHLERPEHADQILMFLSYECDRRRHIRIPSQRVNLRIPPLHGAFRDA